MLGGLGRVWELGRFWKPWEALGGPPALRTTYLASRGCYSTPGCGKAGERAIDVEGHTRRPPSKVGGLCHEFRGLGFRV